MGVGTKLGCEATVHSVREFIHRSDEHYENIIIKLDLSNAFNSVRRDAMLKATFDHMPSIYPLAYESYNRDSNLFFGDFIMKSSCGVQQGDPLGPTLFSIAINDIIKTDDLDLNIWYLDDGCIGGDPDQVIRHTKNLIDHFESIGLKINMAKCELLCLGHTTLSQDLSDLPGIQITKADDWHLLGAPLNEDSIPGFMEKKTAQINTLLKNLDDIEPHQAFFLLKNFLLVPKLTYALRSSPLYKRTEELHTIDNNVKLKTKEICNVDFNEDAWKQATLPFSFGGLGLRSCQDIALPCYISSLHSCTPLAERILGSTDPLSGTTEEAQRSWNGELPNEKRCQKSWDTMNCKTKLASIEDNANQFSKARLLAAQAPHTADWAAAVPINAVGTLLTPQELQVSIALRVGAKVCETLTCKCGKRIDERALHCLSCKLNAGRFPRHTALNRIIKKTLNSVDIPSSLEPIGLCRNDGKRPDGVTLCPWKNGRSMIWDATVCDTFCAANLPQTCLQTASAAAAAEISKCRKYQELSLNYLFQPVAFETTGVWGPDTSRFMQTIKRKLLASTGDHKDFHHLCQLISITINRGNCASIISCIPHQ